MLEANSVAGIKIRRVDLYPDDFIAGTRRLSDAEMGVYVRICLCIYSEGGPVDVESVKSVCSSHGNTFNSIIKRLVDLGKIGAKGPQITQKRCANELERAGKRIAKSEQISAKRWKTKETESSQASPPSTAIIQQTTDNKQQEETRASRASSNEAFDRWWEGYPEKVGKGAAKRAFLKALSKTSLDQLIGGVERYKATKPPDRAWCNPATWLNQERWLDVPATNGIDTAELSFGGPPTEPPPIPEGGFFPVGRDH
jgi:uncharacterized protein YdaU (DUF1376 family)